MSAIPETREVHLADGRVDLIDRSRIDHLPDGRYRDRGGWNWRAVAAPAVGWALAWGALVVPGRAPLYSYGWFVGFRGAAPVHWSLLRLPRGRAHDLDHEVAAGRASASVAVRAPLRPSRSD